MNLGEDRRDDGDALAPLRSLFALPADSIYLDGNSLGPMPRMVAAEVQQLLVKEWSEDLIASWNKHDWIRLPKDVGEQIAPLIGAAPGQVLCADTISINLFKLLSTALDLQSGRRVILLAEGDFPTDGYVAQGLAGLLGEQRCVLRRVPAKELLTALNEEVAVLLLTEVNYRSGERFPMDELTAAAHAAGALTVWDLAHSAGAMKVQLDAARADFAVGCGYKFFNGGPGAPGFLYVAERHQEWARQPLSGWLGHREPFAFEAAYQPATGIDRFQVGTPAVISMVALRAALRVFDRVSLDALRAKSLALTDLFMQSLSEAKLDSHFRCITPREHERRGSQVSLCHDEAWGVSQALIERGVIVDFRAPDIVRFGFAPLYNRFSEVTRAVALLREIMDTQAHRDSRFATRPTVT